MAETVGTESPMSPSASPPRTPALVRKSEIPEGLLYWEAQYRGKSGLGVEGQWGKNREALKAQNGSIETTGGPLFTF